VVLTTPPGRLTTTNEGPSVMAYEYLPHVGPVVTRAEAKAAGLLRYFTGRPCKRGHISDYYTKAARCVACQDEISKAWRRDNRERFDAAAREWRETHKEQFDAVAKVYRATHGREKRAATLKVWVKANEEKIRAQRRALRLANPLRWKCYAENRRARKIAAGGTHTPAQIAALAVKQKHRCVGCGASIKAGFETDHIVALSKGGSNGIGNIQLLCKPCNRSKHARDPIKWAQSRGRLL
jgi:5-methylcytosine-specific restriction endonuclease McrA